MIAGMKESDWKQFRKIHALALERFSRRILDELQNLSTDDTRSCHERYLDVYQLINQRTVEMARMFDDPRRSTALEQLVAIRSAGLITDVEFGEFSQETRNQVTSVLEL